MKINQAYRYELKPNNKQRGLLIKHAGAARFAWNWALGRRKSEYKSTGKSSKAIKQHQELNALKKTEFPWIYEVSKCAPQEALRNLDRAYANFFRGLKTGEDIGFPQFKKKGKHDSFTLTGWNNSLRVESIGIRLPRIGVIRTKEATSKFRGRILSATVSREADRWFVSLCVKRERPEPELIQGDIVGIDLGINSFATIWDGKKPEKIESPKPLKKSLKKLQRLDRQHSRKKKGSRNQKKAALRESQLHRRIRNTRKDFLAKLTTSLTKTKSVIIIEDLNVKGMLRNHCLARSIADCGWGEFRRMLEYKCKWYGSRLIIIGRFEPTSKMCHVCGAVNKDLNLNNRTWVCPSCGAVLDRDENAAINIRRLGIEILYTESSSGIYACGEESSGSSLDAGTKLSSAKQELSTLLTPSGCNK